MKINYLQYHIEFLSDPAFSPDSVDNLYLYNKVYFNPKEYHFPSIFGIKIIENDKLVESAVLGVRGGATEVHENSYILSKNRLYICCGNFVFCFSIPDLEIIWKVEVDKSTCFRIFSVGDDFIINGEMAISRIDRNGNIIWQRGGRDLFVTNDGTNHFSIKGNIISVKDFENNFYKFDLEGNVID